MKVSIEKVTEPNPEEIIIRCYTVDNHIQNILNFIKTNDASLNVKIDDEIFNINIKDIYYIEIVDNKTYVYTKNQVYESKLKLYEMLDVLQGGFFFRSSKSMICNIKKIKCVKASINGRFDATMLNGEIVMISRQYVKDLKEKLGL